MPIKSPEARERDIQYRHTVYRWYKEHGICTRCRTQWSAPGRIYCEACTQKAKTLADARDPGRAQRNAYNKERREQLIAAGLCAECGKRPPLEGRTRCWKCTRKRNEYDQVCRIRKRIQRENERG